MLVVVAMCSVVVIIGIAVAIFGDYKAVQVPDLERPITRNVRQIKLSSTVDCLMTTTTVVGSTILNSLVKVVIELSYTREPFNYSIAASLHAFTKNLLQELVKHCFFTIVLLISRKIMFY